MTAMQYVGEHASPPRALTVWGREPAALLGTVESILILVVATLGAKLGIDDAFVVVAMAVVSGAMSLWTSWATVDTRLANALGLIKAVVALAAYFSFSLDPTVVSAILAVTAAVFGLFNRTQTTPVIDPVQTVPQQVVPVTPPPGVEDVAAPPQDTVLFGNPMDGE